MAATAAVCILLLLCPGTLPSPAIARNAAPAEAGFIRLADARGEDSAFRWEDGVLEGERCLVWPGGLLTLAASVSPEQFGAADLLIPYGEDLRGVGADGALLFRDGRYEIDQPLLLRDASLTLYLAGGVLEIRSGRIDYVWAAKKADSRGQYLILAGVVLAILILVMRARRYGQT